MSANSITAHDQLPDHIPEPLVTQGIIPEPPEIDVTEPMRPARFHEYVEPVDEVINSVAYGTCASEWQINQSTIPWRLTIPANVISNEITIIGPN
jgi:hypothetical protein